MNNNEILYVKEIAIIIVIIGIIIMLALKTKYKKIKLIENLEQNKQKDVRELINEIISALWDIIFLLLIPYVISITIIIIYFFNKIIN